MSANHMLKTLSLDGVESLYKPDHSAAASQADPAMDVVTDFHSNRPLILESGVSVADAVRLMRTAHVHMKFVVDKNERFLGIVSLNILESPDVLQLITERHSSRDELTVADVMTPRERLYALSYAELNTSTIGDMLLTLRELGENHVLVVDEEKMQICGIVSANDIAKYLHVPVDIQQRATNFAEIVHMLAN